MTLKKTSVDPLKACLLGCGCTVLLLLFVTLYSRRVTESEKFAAGMARSLAANRKTPLSSDIVKAQQAAITTFGPELKMSAHIPQALWNLYDETTTWYPSPSGKYLIVQAGRGQIHVLGSVTDLWLVSTQGGSARPLTTDAEGYSDVCWSADESSIAYVCHNGYYLTFDREQEPPNPGVTVYTQNIHSGNRKALFHNKWASSGFDEDKSLVWLPHQPFLLYAAGTPLGTLLLNVEGGSSRRLSINSFSGILPRERAMYWLNDTHSVLTTGQIQPSVTTLASLGTGEKLSMSAGFTFPEALVGLCFSPDGTKLAGWLSASNRLVVLDPASRRVRLLGVVPLPWHGFLRWSQDGQFLFASRTLRQNDTDIVAVSVEASTIHLFGEADWNNMLPAKLLPIHSDLLTSVADIPK